MKRPKKKCRECRLQKDQSLFIEYKDGSLSVNCRGCVNKALNRIDVIPFDWNNIKVYDVFGKEIK